MVKWWLNGEGGEGRGFRERVESLNVWRSKLPSFFSVFFSNSSFGMRDWPKGCWLVTMRMTSSKGSL